MFFIFLGKWEVMVFVKDIGSGVEYKVIAGDSYYREWEFVKTYREFY